MSSRKSLGAGGRVAGLMRPPPVAPAMTFPILTAEELVVSLSEMGIAIVEDDIIKCRQDVLKNVFDQLIMTVLNVTSDELYQAKFAGLAAVEENSELHEESVHIVHWLRAMSVRPRAAPVQPRHGVAVHRGCALHSCRAVPPSPPPFPAPTLHHPLPLPPHRNKLLAAAGMPEGYALKDLVKPDRAKVAKALSCPVGPGLGGEGSCDVSRRGRAHRARRAPHVDWRRGGGVCVCGAAHARAGGRRSAAPRPISCGHPGLGGRG